MAFEHMNPEELLAFDGFTQVVVAPNRGRVAYIAGQVSCDKSFKVIGEGDYSAQMINALKNVKIAVEAVGGTVDQVVSSTVYVRGLSPETTDLYLRAMAVVLDGKPFPAHSYTLVGVESLAGPGTLVEISAIAMIE